MAGNVRAYKWYDSNLTEKFPDSVCAFKSLCRLNILQYGEIYWDHYQSSIKDWSKYYQIRARGARLH